MAMLISRSARRFPLGAFATPPHEKHDDGYGRHATSFISLEAHRASLVIQ